MQKSSSKISRLIAGIEKGEIDPVSALCEIGARRNPDMDFAHIDHSRKSRCGFPEFIFGKGKTFRQLTAIIRELHKRKQAVLVTRLASETGKKLSKKFSNAEYDKTAGTLIIRNNVPPKGLVLIITAGTTDMPVALEAKYTLEACGCVAELITDSGVAGIHRLLSELPSMRKADVIIAVAGMEGALPSVTAGLVSCPVIAVPTSVGYGTSLGGLTAMFAMLNSCANGVTVVNIDNGFGAACAAARIINMK